MTQTAVVFGAGGLLGSGLVAELRRREVEVTAADVRWASAHALADISRVVEIAPSGSAWFWCAGRGVTSSSEVEFDAEIRVFHSFLGALERRHGGRSPRVFLASSAGALFSGSTSPPFDDHSAPKPLMAYGRAKLCMEDHLAGFAARTGMSAWIGRMSNLYGPGQDLTKPQGLISHVVRASVRGEPVKIFVPLETRRDYLFVTDCARMIVDGTLGSDLYPTLVIPRVLLCHGRSESVAGILAAVGAELSSNAPYVMQESELARGQSLDLTMRPTTWGGLNAVPKTPLAQGVAATIDDVRMRMLRADRIEI